MSETRLHQYITGKSGTLSAVESQINTIFKYSITSNEILDFERPVTHSHSNIISIDRPDSSQLVDLHVYILARSTWKDRQNFAYNDAMDEAISSGFVRVPNHLTLSQMREQLESQIGGDETFPREYIFLRSVGRAMTRVKRKQEIELRVKNFRPPQTFAPEIFLLEGKYEDYIEPGTPNSLISPSTNNMTASKQRLGPISRSRVENSLVSENIDEENSRELRKLYEEQDRLKRRQNELERLRLEAERQMEEDRRRQQELDRLLRQKQQEEKERDVAAIKIQSTYRGYRDRKHVNDLKLQRHEELRRHDVDFIPAGDYHVKVNILESTRPIDDDAEQIKVPLTPTTQTDLQTIQESDYSALKEISIREFRKQARTPLGLNIKEILGDDMDRETLSSSANYYNQGSFKLIGAEIENLIVKSRSEEEDDDDDYQNAKAESEDYILPYQQFEGTQKKSSGLRKQRIQSQLQSYPTVPYQTRSSVLSAKSNGNVDYPEDLKENEEPFDENNVATELTHNPFINQKSVLLQRPITNHEQKRGFEPTLTQNLIKSNEINRVEDPSFTSMFNNNNTEMPLFRLASAKVPLKQDSLITTSRISNLKNSTSQLNMIDEKTNQFNQQNQIISSLGQSFEQVENVITPRIDSGLSHSVENTQISIQKSSLVELRRNSSPFLSPKMNSQSERHFSAQEKQPLKQISRLTSAVRRDSTDERTQFDSKTKGFSSSFAKSCQVIEEDYRSVVSEGVQEIDELEEKPMKRKIENKLVASMISRLSTARFRKPLVHGDFPTPEIVSTNTSRIQLETRTSVVTNDEAARGTRVESQHKPQSSSSSSSSESMASCVDDEEVNGEEVKEDNLSSSDDDYNDIYILTDSQIDAEWQSFLTKNSQTNFAQVFDDLKQENQHVKQVELKRLIVKLSRNKILTNLTSQDEIFKTISNHLNRNINNKNQIKLAEINLKKDEIKVHSPSQVKQPIVTPTPLATPPPKPPLVLKPVVQKAPTPTIQNHSLITLATNNSSVFINNSNLSYSYDADYQINIKKTESMLSDGESSEPSHDYYQTDTQEIYQDEINLLNQEHEYQEEPVVSIARNIEIDHEKYETTRESTPEPLIQLMQKPLARPRTKTPVSFIKNEPLKVDEKRQLSNESKTSLNDDALSIEELRKKLAQTRASRVEFESLREELIRKLKLIHNRISLRRKEAKDLWKKKYFAEKKNTPPLEEKVKVQLGEIETLQKKIYFNMEHDTKNPQSDANQKLASLKLQQELDLLKRQVEQVKLRLTTDIKLRNQAEAESKALRTELSQTKANLHHIKNKALQSSTAAAAATTNATNEQKFE